MPTFKTLLAGAFVLGQLAFAAIAQTLPPAPPQKIAVNPLTNKVYTANHDADTVTVFNAATGTSVPIAVGDGPSFMAVNPVTNRVYVNNSRAASLSVIDGATDTLIGTFTVGSSGPIAVNPVTNVVYIVRLTGTGTDEVTYFNGATNSWYTISTQSHQPIAVAVNPVTNKVFIAHYATGDVRIIDGTFNPNDDHPAAISRGVWSKPFALAVNPVTNKVFVITEDSRGPIAVLDANTLSTTFLLAGTARVPKAVAVNPVTNKAYALFSNELVVIDGSTLATTSIPVADAGTAAATLAVNTVTNRILVSSATGVLTVVDGGTNAVVTTAGVPAGTSGVALNAATGTTYYFDSVLHAVARAAGETPVANPVTTTITPLAGNTTTPTFTLTLNASSSFAPNALPIRTVYYRLDTTTGPWTAATGTGPYTASFSGVAPGSHTVYAFAVEGQDAPLATGAHSAPLIGTMASYAFTVSSPKVDPSISLASSSNPSTAGSQVTFTASVSGSSGTPTGTVTFRDGGTALCTAVPLASAAATCSSATLSAGTHAITAEYSGDASYHPRTSGILQQQVSPGTTVPGAPTNLLATPGNGAATFTFSPPSSNGGSPITSYRVSCTPGQSSASAAVSPITVTGLTNGTTYSCSAVAINAVGSGPASAPVSVTPGGAAIPRLGNISSRLHVGTGEDVMIGGFVIGGSTPKRVAIVATGPSLSAFGISNPLANPTLRLVRGSDQATIATNDDWQSATNHAQLSAAGLAPPHALEAAILVDLSPGAYTAIVQGAGGSTGVAVIGVYEVDHPEVPLVNISTRGRVAAGEGVMIGGFIINGAAPKTVAVVATGPSLANFGIASPLPNPKVTLVRSSDGAVVATNDDWATHPNASQLQAAGLAPSKAAEAGLYLTLPPGAYTAVVEGVGGGSGVAVVGVYAVN